MKLFYSGTLLSCQNMRITNCKYNKLNYGAHTSNDDWCVVIYMCVNKTNVIPALSI